MPRLCNISDVRITRTARVFGQGSAGTGTSTSGSSRRFYRTESIDGRPASLLQAFQLLDERRALQVEKPRRLALVPARPVERTLDEIAFDAGDERVEIEALVGQREQRADRRRRRFQQVGGQVRQVDLRAAAAERDGALDGVFE